MRWIDQNKRDGARPDYRSRLVVQGTRASGTMAAGDIAATFAATPPLEALRLFVGQVMTGGPGSEIVLRFLDISRAHPHCPIHRKVYIRLPQEGPSSGDRAMCETAPGMLPRTSSSRPLTSSRTVAVNKASSVLACGSTP